MKNNASPEESLVMLATFHILGALFASLVLVALSVWIKAWDQERIKKRRLKDVSLALGVPLADLDNEDLIPKMLQYSSQRFSGELLKNRVADLCGLLCLVWVWFGSFVQLAIIVMVAWQMYETGPEAAVFMWAVVAAGLFFWTSSLLLSLSCLLVTGRYPSEPRLARKSISEFIEERGAVAGG
jgi:hypothetical protein